jgi:hypothetical protein
MTEELIALVGAKEIGRVHRHTRGRLTFAYDDAWRVICPHYVGLR